MMKPVNRIQFLYRDRDMPAPMFPWPYLFVALSLILIWQNYFYVQKDIKSICVPLCRLNEENNILKEQIRKLVHNNQYQMSIFFLIFSKNQN